MLGIVVGFVGIVSNKSCVEHCSFCLLIEPRVQELWQDRGASGQFYFAGSTILDSLNTGTVIVRPQPYKLFAVRQLQARPVDCVCVVN